MKQLRKKILAIFLLTCASTIVQAQTLSATNGILDIVAGRVSSFPVNLSDGKPDAYNALTLSIYLPEGFSLTDNPKLTNKWDNPFCITQESIILPDSAQIQQYESIMFQAIGDIDENRNFKMAVASANELPGTNIDSLLTISFEVEPNVENKVYSIKLQNILLEYDSVKHDDPSDVLVRVRVCMLGDANRDNKVNVIDVTLIINYILNRDSGLEYNALLADMNEDGFIDIFDIMKLINVVVNGKMPVVDEIMARAAVAPQYEDMELAFIKNGVTMSIPNAQRFSSFQFDIEVPDDIELKDTKLIGVNTNHIIQFAKTDYCQYRVVCLSLDNSILESDGKDFLILDIPNCGKVKIHDAMFVNSQGIATYFCDKEIENGITGINSTVTSKDDSVFDLSGRKVKNENRHLHKGIYIINNKRVVVK